MTVSHEPLLRLPLYDDFVASIHPLNLDLSASGLHGILCGYLCAGADTQGEDYIRALLHNKKDESSRQALLSLFSMYAISQQQINHFDFSFELLLPDDDEPLLERAKAFSEWCNGFSWGFTAVGIDAEQFEDEDSQNAVQHIHEFAELDYAALDIDEEDERALMDVIEYTRMAVAQLHSELVLNQRECGGIGTAH